MALIAKEQGEYDIAIQYFSEAISYNYYDAKAYYGRGMLRRKTDDKAGGMVDIKTAATMNPKYTLFLFGRGIAKIKTHDIVGEEFQIQLEKPVGIGNPANPVSVICN